MKLRCSLLPLALTASLFSQNQPPKEPAKCAIRGLVVQEPGSQPLKKVTVHLLAVTEDPGNAQSSTTDAEGRFQFEKLEAGRYRITVEKPGFVDTRKWKWGQAVSLAPGQEFKDVVLSLQPAAVIVGKVLDGDGDPVANVNVVVTRYGSSRSRNFWPATGMTDDLGQYRVANLVPGRYLLLASPTGGLFESSSPEINSPKSDGQTYVATYYPGTTEASQAVPIEVHAGDEVPINILLVKARTFRVRGSIAGDLLTSTAVTLRSRDSSSFFWRFGQLGKDGTFMFDGVPPGSYSLDLVTFGDGGSANTSTLRRVDIVDADFSETRIVPLPPATVRGRLRIDEPGKEKLDRFGIYLSPESDSTPQVSFGDPQARVKSDGTFEFRSVAEGRFRLGISQGWSREYFVKSVEMAGRDVTDNGISISSGSYVLEVVVSRKVGSLEGVVLDSKDQPVPDTSVVLTPDPLLPKREDLVQQTHTDQHGRFRFPGIAPRKYVLLAPAETPDDFKDPEFLAHYASSGEKVEVGENDHKTATTKLIPAPEEKP